MRRTHLLACAGLALFTVLASGGLAAAAPDPCVIVSKADAEKLAGKPMKEAGHSQVACSYGPPEPGLPTVEVYVGDAAERYLTIEQSLGRKFRTFTGAVTRPSSATPRACCSSRSPTCWSRSGI